MALGPRTFARLFAAFCFLALLAFPGVRASADNDPLMPLAPLQIPPLQTQSAQKPAPTTPPTATQPQTTQAQTSQTGKEDSKSNNDRVFFVMPNFLTVENAANIKPLRWKQKFALVSKGVFDPYEYTVVGILAGIRQAENAYPAFGQGVEGYAKRYGTAIADQIDGNFMVGAIYPTILRTDPRYFQLGQGTFVHRVSYAISRLFITRKDSGGETFNLSESLGNGTAIGISNLYYPASDRGFTSSISDWGVQMGIDAVGNELKEFWPDLHRRFARKKKAAPAPQATPSSQ